MLITALCQAHSDHIYGRTEKASLLPENIPLKVKLDTGAMLASLQAEHIEYFDKDRMPWIRFTLRLGEKSYQIERPFLSEARIKNRVGESTSKTPGVQTRPVVIIHLCLDNQELSIPTTLTDRSNFTTPMLLGRDAMIKYHIAIDPSMVFTSSPQCNTTLPPSQASG